MSTGSSGLAKSADGLFARNECTSRCNGPSVYNNKCLNSNNTAAYQLRETDVSLESIAFCYG